MDAYRVINTTLGNMNISNDVIRDDIIQFQQAIDDFLSVDLIFSTITNVTIGDWLRVGRKQILVQVISIQEVDDGTGSLYTVHCRCGVNFMRHLIVNETYVDKTSVEIINDLMKNYVNPYEAPFRHVVNFTDTNTYRFKVFTNRHLIDCLREICDENDAYFHTYFSSVDTTKDTLNGRVVFEKYSGSQDAPQTLNDVKHDSFTRSDSSERTFNVAHASGRSFAYTPKRDLSVTMAPTTTTVGGDLGQPTRPYVEGRRFRNEPDTVVAVQLKENVLDYKIPFGFAKVTLDNIEATSFRAFRLRPGVVREGYNIHTSTRDGSKTFVRDRRLDRSIFQIPQTQRTPDTSQFLVQIENKWRGGLGSAPSPIADIPRERIGANNAGWTNPTVTAQGTQVLLNINDGFIHVTHVLPYDKSFTFGLSILGVPDQTIFQRETDGAAGNGFYLIDGDYIYIRFSRTVPEGNITRTIDTYTNYPNIVYEEPRADTVNRSIQTIGRKEVYQSSYSTLDYADLQRAAQRTNWFSTLYDVSITGEFTQTDNTKTMKIGDKFTTTGKERTHTQSYTLHVNSLITSESTTVGGQYHVQNIVATSRRRFTELDRDYHNRERLNISDDELFEQNQQYKIIDLYSEITTLPVDPNGVVFKVKELETNGGAFILGTNTAATTVGRGGHATTPLSSFTKETRYPIQRIGDTLTYTISGAEYKELELVTIIPPRFNRLDDTDNFNEIGMIARGGGANTTPGLLVVRKSTSDSNDPDNFKLGFHPYNNQSLLIKWRLRVPVLLYE